MLTILVCLPACLAVPCCNRCVCIVYDPQKSARGQVAVKAIRLKDTFISLFKEGKLTGVCEALRGQQQRQKRQQQQQPCFVA